MNQFLWAFQNGNSRGTDFTNLSTGASSRQASRDAADARREVDELEEKVQHLEVINRAIWELLKECTNLTEEDLLLKVREVDCEAENNGPRACPSCDRPNSLQRRNCLYCGEQLPLNSAFDAL